MCPSKEAEAKEVDKISKEDMASKRDISSHTPSMGEVIEVATLLERASTHPPAEEVGLEERIINLVVDMEDQALVMVEQELVKEEAVISLAIMVRHARKKTHAGFGIREIPLTIPSQVLLLIIHNRNPNQEQQGSVRTWIMVLANT